MRDWAIKDVYKRQGPTVEKRLVEGIEIRYDLEAKALIEFLNK